MPKFKDFSSFKDFVTENKQPTAAELSSPVSFRERQRKIDESQQAEVLRLIAKKWFREGMTQLELTHALEDAFEAGAESY
jgi:hypothetical protein